jgi:hypothetical protein
MAKPNKRWAAFWAAIFAIGIGGEGVALAADRSSDPLSVTVWWILGLHQGIRFAGMAAFIAGGIWLFGHFFFKAPKP